MIDLTIVILTKNEEDNIKKCIESFKGIAKRFVVVDSYSEDSTYKVCMDLNKHFKVDFYQNTFVSHSSQFNWALEKTNIDTEWIMRIDADEEATENLVNELNGNLEKVEKGVNGILLNRRIYFMGKWIKYGGIYPMKVLRLFRNGFGKSEDRLMDEHIVLKSGKIVDFNMDFIDNNTKNIDWWINKHNWYSNRELTDYINKKNAMEDKTDIRPSLFKGQTERKRWLKYIVYYKTPLLKRARWYFIYRYFLRLGFLDGKEGLIYHFLQGYWYRFLVDSKIYEYNKNNIASKNKKF